MANFGHVAKAGMQIKRSGGIARFGPGKSLDANSEANQIRGKRQFGRRVGQKRKRKHTGSTARDQTFGKRQVESPDRVRPKCYCAIDATSERRLRAERLLPFQLQRDPIKRCGPA